MGVEKNLGRNNSLRTALLTALILGVLLYFTAILFADNAPNQRTVSLEYQFKITDLPKTAKTVCVWVPIPPTNAWQELKSFTVSGNQKYRLVNEPVHKNRYLYFSCSQETLDATNTVAATITFNVARSAYRILPPASQSERFVKERPSVLKRALASNRLIPIEGEIAEEAKQVTGSGLTSLEKERMLYDYIVQTVRYDKTGVGWGKGDAIYACRVRKGNCTDFHSLFIGESRAIGIPTRFVIGIPLPEDKVEGTIPGYHCWAEFYIDRIGWIPVDASEASKFPGKKETFFGGLDANRIQFTMGRDIRLPLSKDEPVNYSIYPYVEVNGKAYPNVQTSFSFRER